TAYLHTFPRVVHGDLKCENVLVSEDGKALLTDFGLSTTIDKLVSDTTTRTEIRHWNTLRFAAPELLFDAARSTSGRLRSKTPETDVYAFGMLAVQVS
ncbi:kinase-like protein, partial [Auricularia subglabra TFB-10046 SS5]